MTYNSHWQDLHQSPGRWRLRVEALQGNPVQSRALARQLRLIPGVKNVRVNDRIANITLSYDHKAVTFAELEKQVAYQLQQALEQSTDSAAINSSNNLAEDISRELPNKVASDGHIAVLTAILLATPLMPVPMRYAATLLALSPNLLKTIKSLRQGASPKRALESGALLLSTLTQRYGVAQINNLMQTLGRRLERDTVASTETHLRQQASIPQLQLDILRRFENGQFEDGQLKNDEQQLQCELTELKSGDQLTLHAGQTLPLDALVVSGLAQIREVFADELQSVSCGRRINAGSQIQSGELKLVLLQDWQDGTLVRVGDFIDAAIRDRESHDQYAANLADRLVPYTVMLAAVSFAFSRDLGRVSSVLQTDFSTAHELVTPIQVESTISAAASEGILFRSGRVIERLAGLDTLVFDRSGTLTCSDWQLQQLTPLANLDEPECHKLLCKLLLHGCRPAALHAVGEHCPTLADVSHAEIHQIQEQGLHLRYQGQSLALTDVRKTHQQLGAAPQADSDHSLGLSFYLTLDDVCIARVLYRNELRKDNLISLDALNHQGIDNLYLLTHEPESSLHPEFANLPLSERHCDMSVRQKRDFVRRLVEQGHKVGVVSDGMFHAGRDCLEICLGTEPHANPLEADIWLMRAGIGQLSHAHQLAQDSTQQLKRGHRTTQGSKGSMLLASSFNLLPPAVAATLGNLVTLGVMAKARKPVYKNSNSDISTDQQGDTL